MPDPIPFPIKAPPAISLDAAWFKANPARLLRLRRQTREEVATWPVPPRAGFTAWCIVARDATVTPFGYPEGEAPDDADHALRVLLRTVANRPEDMPEAERRALVAEAFHTFGEPAARSLAALLAVTFEDCRPAIDHPTEDADVTAYAATIIRSPEPGGELARLEASILALLTACEPHTPDAPAAKAYRKALRDRAQEARAIGGADALAYLARRVVEADPSRAEVREAILSVAWEGLM